MEDNEYIFGLLNNCWEPIEFDGGKVEPVIDPAVLAEWLDKEVYRPRLRQPEGEAWLYPPYRYLGNEDGDPIMR